MNEKVDTKARILDAAEKLFGERGFESTSLRDITAEAQVNLAAVNYHFQSKDSLIDAVVARRIEPINRLRLGMLDAAGPNPTLEQILRAFLLPVLELKRDAVMPLLGRTLSDPHQFVEKVYKKHLLAISERIHRELAKALPGLPVAELRWRLYFAAGVMTYILSWSKVLPDISGGLCDPSDRQALIDRVIDFLAAGFRAPVNEPAFERVLLEKEG
ncbi:MAG: TetR family transcriptional regulator [Bryobacterales bacterium]|nr:TetR family transcriptional regulator [Bryobacterales bacterium]MBV9400788.1 TetR family transcriptional regulator [Bryobacterales bacterium]